jgi:flavin-dependent dehydrogenase
MNPCSRSKKLFGGGSAGDLYDVAVIGGGPAGSTAAALLARAGRRVIVFEREKFPRFHIGESLLPFSMKAFTRLGLHEKFAGAGFMEKFGGEICSACTDKGVKFYFKDGFRSQTDHAYQVTRGDFDKVLLNHASESGAEVHEETTVERISFGNEQVELEVGTSPSLESFRGSAQRADPTRTARVRARFVIDASGRNSLVGNYFGLKKNYEHLQKMSIFAHYDGVERDQGIDGTLTRMVRGIDRWFWLIPLTAERTSVGIVFDSATFRAAKKSPAEFLDEALAEQPQIANRMQKASRVSPVYTAADFSYRNTRLAGDRWLLAGDAAGFIDPVFSSGVFLAVLAGEKAADALHEALDRPEKTKKLFARYERTINRAMDVYLRFVDAWYTKEFIEVFLNPQEFLQIQPAVNAVLGGNIGNSFAIRWRMSIFYMLVWLQRYLPLCPRRTLVPNRERMSKSSESLVAIS